MKECFDSKVEEEFVENEGFEGERLTCFGGES